MHPCLTILEVQRAIFREVNKPHEGKATLACIARTCRTLSGVALDVLWAKLDSFVCLIKCLPGDLLKIHVVRPNIRVIFLRPMSLKDWDVFFSYSNRVRTLSQSFQPQVMRRIKLYLNLDNDVVYALSNPPTLGSLVPNLRELHWDAPDKKHVPLLRVLLTPILVTLSLSSCALRSPEISILSSIGNICPSLRDLRITWSDRADYALDARGKKILSEALVHMRSLETLSCPAPNEAVIILLSHPPLVNLTLELPRDFQPEEVWPRMVAPISASLKSLELHAHSLSTLTSLLESMRFKPTKVSFVVESTPTPDAVRSFSLALVSACDPKELVEISFTTSNANRPPAQHTPFTLSAFQPFLTLSNIKKFEFDVPCDMALNDDAIVSLTTHWPNLTMLSLNARSGWGIPSNVTHIGLIMLLERCTALYEFALEIDFSSVDRNSFEPRFTVRPGGGVSNEECRHANFITSTIKFPASIAMFLSDVCPDLLDVSSTWKSKSYQRQTDPDTDTDADGVEECGKEWKEVQNLFPMFSLARKQCLNWVQQKKDKVKEE